MAEPSNLYADRPDPSKVLHVIPSDSSWDGDWELTADLVIEIQASGEQVLAVSRHLTVGEYGEGTSVKEAVQDLLTSLSEYRESLEEREARLGSSAAEDLAKMRSIIRRL